MTTATQNTIMFSTAHAEKENKKTLTESNFHKLNLV